MRGIPARFPTTEMHGNPRAPPAVLNLVGFLFYDFAGTAVLDKR